MKQLLDTFGQWGFFALHTALLHLDRLEVKAGFYEMITQTDESE